MEEEFRIKPAAAAAVTAAHVIDREDAHSASEDATALGAANLADEE
jgi:hypothetical protein